MELENSSSEYQGLLAPETCCANKPQYQTGKMNLEMYARRTTPVSVGISTIWTIAPMLSTAIPPELPTASHHE